jgi:hypothetical protein
MRSDQIVQQVDPAVVHSGFLLFSLYNALFVCPFDIVAMKRISPPRSHIQLPYFDDVVSMDFQNALKRTRTEEEVKFVYAEYFGLKYSSSDRHDLYTPQVLFEFKFNRNFYNQKELAATIAQTLYYIRRLKFSIQQQFDNSIDKPIPSILCFADKNCAVISETVKWKTFYENPDYDWDLAPSTPDPQLVNALAGSPLVKKLHVYHVDDKNEFSAFAELLRKHLDSQPTFPFELRKIISEENFEDVYEYWNTIFGESVKNNFKPSRYFVTDIQENASWLEKKEGKVYFKVGHSGKPIAKKIIAEDYNYFWSLYEKIKNLDVARSILAKIDRITDIDQRRRFGEFFTPLPFAKKAL